MARRSHPFPYRTRKLSFSAPMVVGACAPVRVGRCQAKPQFGAIILSNFYFWPLGQAVKTPPFHGGNTGSSPVGVTIFRRISSAGRASALQAEGRRFDPVILHHLNIFLNYAGVAQLVEHDRISPLKNLQHTD